MSPTRFLFLALAFTFATLFSFNQSYAQNGNVGIGTTTPRARLHVTDSNVVFTVHLLPELLHLLRQYPVQERV